MLRKVDLSVARAVLVYGLAIILKLRETTQTKQHATAQHLSIQNTGGLVEYPVKDAPRVQKAANPILYMTQEQQ